MFKRLPVLSLIFGPICSLIFAAPVVHAQALPTATRMINGQIGAGVSGGSPDYTSSHIAGISIYGTLDFGRHWGIDGEIHDLNIYSPADVGETTYLLGGRYHLNKGRLKPYAKGLVGAGVFSFQQGYFPKSVSYTYKMYALGAGLDFEATPRINIRVVDFEFQDWITFSPNDLQPYVVTVGAAYRF